MEKKGSANTSRSRLVSHLGNTRADIFGLLGSALLSYANAGLGIQHLHFYPRILLRTRHTILMIDRLPYLIGALS
jgi:hypothetical protein